MVLEYSEQEATAIANFLNEINYIQSIAEGDLRSELDEVINKLPQSVFEKAFCVSECPCFKEWVMVNGIPTFNG